jgi:hypothetical protein
MLQDNQIHRSGSIYEGGCFYIILALVLPDIKYDLIAVMICAAAVRNGDYFYIVSLRGNTSTQIGRKWCNPTLLGRVGPYIQYIHISSPFSLRTFIKFL